MSFMKEIMSKLSLLSQVIREKTRLKMGVGRLFDHFCPQGLSFTKLSFFTNNFIQKRETEEITNLTRPSQSWFKMQSASSVRSSLKECASVLGQEKTVLTSVRSAVIFPRVKKSLNSDTRVSIVVSHITELFK